jgi:hypothetical protein
MWVTSGFTVPPQGMAPYMRLLLQDAFVNYRTLMNDVTLSPAMGRYLDMVNNDNPPTGQHANENYARELMQLFTLGLDKLNEDGTLQLDSSGNPIPTYTQANVDAFALAYTGWTYPTRREHAGKAQPGLLDRTHGAVREQSQYGSEGSSPCQRHGSHSSGWPIGRERFERRARQYFRAAEFASLCLQTADSASGEQQSQQRLREARRGCLYERNFQRRRRHHRFRAARRHAGCDCRHSARFRSAPRATPPPLRIPATDTFASPFSTSPTFCAPLARRPTARRRPTPPRP